MVYAKLNARMDRQQKEVSLSAYPKGADSPWSSMHKIGFAIKPWQRCDNRHLYKRGFWRNYFEENTIWGVEEANEQVPGGDGL